MIETISKNVNNKLLQRARLLQKEIGHTPLYPIKKLLSRKNITLYAKQEWKQLSGSVKCRPAYYIILHALENGLLNERKTLLDATSGNTGIAYAAIAAKIGIKVALCLPENATKERKAILQSLGVEIIYTSRLEGTDGAQIVAKDRAKKYPDKYFYADQYKNENNWKAHYYTTAPEIFSALPGITHFVAGLGTTGTFIGTGRRLKELSPGVHLTSLQPDTAMHGLEGWKHLETASIPHIYDNGVANENLEVSTEEAYEIIKASARFENLLLSPSSAANIAGTLKVIEKIEKGVVVTILPDNAEKYSEVIKKLI